ncbi:MAG: hypothetical protein HYW07_03225 [Candidatus Latescibacteria bacterium]|nr:hypothetical protein [Candidatus Latescibacterota bacterium]
MAPAPLSLGQVAGPLKIRSRLLGAELWLVPEDYAGPALDAPAYTAAECRLLVALQPEAGQLRAIHLVKEHFAGELVEDEAEAGELLARYRLLEKELAAGGGSEAEFLRLARRLGQTLDQSEEQ